VSAQRAELRPSLMRKLIEAKGAGATDYTERKTRVRGIETSQENCNKHMTIVEKLM